MSHPGYYKLQDKESREPFLANDNKTRSLDSISEEPNETLRGKLSKRQKIFITCFVVVSLLVVIVVCVVMTQGIGKFNVTFLYLLYCYCASFYANSHRTFAESNSDS